MKEDRVITPTNQVRLTNVSVVRLNRLGKRFEVACYKNKIVNYRQGIETDLTEVLQTTRIFSNVSKGEFSPTASLQDAFDTTDENEICKWILDKGQIQVSNLERAAKLENKGLEIATMISEKCVNTMSQRRFTIQAIRDAMKEAEFCVHARKEVKQQFLDCVKLLQKKKVLPIERARMRLAIIGLKLNGADNMKQIIDELNDLNGVKEITPSDINDDPLQITFLADPSLYRIIDKLVKEKNEIEINRLRLEIIQQCVFQEGEVNLGSELERKEQLLALQEQQKEFQLNNDIDMNDITEQIEETNITVKNSRKQKKGKKKNKKKEKEDLKADSESKVIDNFDEEEFLTNRQKAKKAQKKSKKAKRREIEAATERLEQQRAEEERQEEFEKNKTLKKSKSRQKSNKGSSKSADSTISPPLPNEVGANIVSPSSCINVNSVGGPTLNTSRGSEKSCNTCGGSFTVIEYRAHFRSEWHRHNLKLKMKGLPVVNEVQYHNRDGDIFIE